ncbi:unnamed protein product [Ambrosiozyma monospora]|uniref:Unnamed protein product n=1 Tax=Ambrosiozyma monospora TaxID=43982 RepID=A0A9W7DKA6_AMBMO|nr:unnamed protein product [Ambrosiozyma monospora]
MGLADKLLADFSSDEDDDDEQVDLKDEELDELDQDHNSEAEHQDNDYDDEMLESNLTKPRQKRDFNYLMVKNDLSGVTSLRKYSSVLPKLESLLRKLDTIKNTDPDMIDREMENDFLSDANNKLTDIKTEISEVFSFVKSYYKSIWPDLEDLVRNPIDFAQVVKIIKDNVSLVSNNSKILENVLKKEEILGLTMSASLVSQQAKPQFEENYMKLILEACDIILELNSSRQKIRDFVTERAKAIAPNVTAIIGPSVTAQLISSYGLENLCKTPACNLPSVGVNNSASRAAQIGPRNKGYLYYSDLVQSVADEFRVQAMRMVSGKVILASRIDYSQRESTKSDDSNGQKWKKEITNKLEKLQAPPDQSKSKPLPKPVEQKSKKRGGRRFRKLKERMAMSDLAKAQNKMAFGKEEETRMDAFGEEIGLGMAGKFSNGGSYRTMAETKKAQMTKAMASKIQKFAGNANNGPGNEGGSKLIKSLNVDDRLLSLQGSSNGNGGSKQGDVGLPSWLQPQQSSGKKRLHDDDDFMIRRTKKRRS